MATWSTGFDATALSLRVRGGGIPKVASGQTVASLRLCWSGGLASVSEARGLALGTSLEKLLTSRVLGESAYGGTGTCTAANVSDALWQGDDGGMAEVRLQRSGERPASGGGRGPGRPAGGSAPARRGAKDEARKAREVIEEADAARAAGRDPPDPAAEAAALRAENRRLRLERDQLRRSVQQRQVPPSPFLSPPSPTLTS